MCGRYIQCPRSPFVVDNRCYEADTFASTAEGAVRPPSSAPCQSLCFCSKRERVEVFVSDLALLLVTSGLYKLGSTFGWTWLLCTYGIPYLIVNHYLVRPHPITREC